MPKSSKHSEKSSDSISNSAFSDKVTKYQGSIINYTKGSAQVRKRLDDSG